MSKRPRPYKWKEGEGNVGDIVWCLHHDRLIEALYEHAIYRVMHIESYKPRHQRPTRLCAFRPVKGRLPQAVTKACAVWSKAATTLSEADVAWSEAVGARSWTYAVCPETVAALSKAESALSKAESAWSKADGALSKAVQDSLPEILALFHKECPGVEFRWWHGLVFPEVQE